MLIVRGLLLIPAVLQMLKYPWMRQSEPGLCKLLQTPLDKALDAEQDKDTVNEHLMLVNKGSSSFAETKATHGRNKCECCFWTDFLATRGQQKQAVTLTLISCVFGCKLINNLWIINATGRYRVALAGVIFLESWWIQVSINACAKCFWSLRTRLSLNTSLPTLSVCCRLPDRRCTPIFKQIFCQKQLRLKIMLVRAVVIWIKTLKLQKTKREQKNKRVKRC